MKFAHVGIPLLIAALTVIAGHAQAFTAFTYTIDDAAAEDIGTASQAAAFAPYGSFPNNPYSLTPDADHGCDGDAFANFGGLNANTSLVTTCGDTEIVAWAGGTVGVTSTLTDTLTPNGTGFEFHVEDSSGSGTQSCALPESLTVNGVGTGSFALPCSVTFGNAGDSLTIPSFDVPITIGTSTFYLISPGTSVLGSTNSTNDDWAFETNLTGCVSFGDTGLGSCGTSTSAISAFKADDPLFAAPEPSSLLIFGAAAATLGAIRRTTARRRAG